MSLKKLTKAAKGIELEDVSNTALRNILTGLSRKIYGKFHLQDLMDAFEFFDGKCPYTGKDLRPAIEGGEGGFATDHIIPQNREHLGLNVRGNLVLADANANAQKGKMTAEEFLRSNKPILAGTSKKEREERIKKIKEFQKINGYDPNLIKQKLSAYLTKLYDDIREEQEAHIDEAVKLTGLPVLVPNVRTPAKKGSNKGYINVPVLLNPSDPEEFKEELLKKKLANITLNYADGSHRESVWKANNFDSTSNVMENIKSRPFWRTRKSDGLIEVIITIK